MTSFNEKKFQEKSKADVRACLFQEGTNLYIIMAPKAVKVATYLKVTEIQTHLPEMKYSR